MLLFLLFCAVLVSVSLYAGRNAYKDCDKCHVVFKNDSSTILTGLYKPYPAGIKPSCNEK